MQSNSQPTKTSQSRKSSGTIVKVSCIAVLGAALFVVILLAISPYPSAYPAPASTALGHWFIRGGTEPFASSLGSLFPPLPPLAVLEHLIVPTKLDYASKLIGTAESGLRILAYIVGGLFAYWKFFKGRTFHPRLEPSVTAAARTEAGQVILRVSCKLKNVGLSSIDLDREHSAIRILLRDLPLSSDIAEIEWGRKSNLSVDVFQNHEWIEGGETIEDQHLFVFPSMPRQSCRVELRMYRIRRTLMERRREWKRRRKGPNAWAHHFILDQFDSRSRAETQDRSDK